MTEEQRKVIVKQELHKSLNFLENAETLMEMKMWNVAANRAYYALYHAIMTLMIHDGYAPKTHSGLITEFGKEYILTGKFDVKHSKLLSQMRNIREKCDYDAFYYTTEEEMVPVVQSTRELIETIAQSMNRDQ